MSSVKELLKKIINEEIEKLEEQNIAQLGTFVNRALGSIEDGTCGSVCQKQIAKLDPSGLQRLQRKGFLPDDRYQAIKSAREGNLKAARTWLGAAGMTSDTPAKAAAPAVAKAAQLATDPKGKGAAGGKAVAKKATTKRKPRRKSKAIFDLQSLLKARFGDKINLGKTGKNKDGADGVYGTLTQRAIGLLRKTDKNAPKRQGSFEKSVRALVDYLKGAGKGAAKGKAKGPAPFNDRQLSQAALKGIFQVTGDKERGRDLLQTFWPSISRLIAAKDSKVTLDGKPNIVKIHNYARDLAQANWSPTTRGATKR